MQISEDIKKIITQAKNICVIPNQQNEPESLTSALALFYTLRELGKNVNIITQDVPEHMGFLIPSLDFISQPKNFVISIPRALADISQVYYEKNDDNLKIHLTIDKGNIKKEQLAFYFQDAKPDLVITLGIQDFQGQLASRLDSFGFILDAPLLNIDNHQDNKKFGKINLVETASLPEIIVALAQTLNENAISSRSANCLLAALMIHYDNFQNPLTTPDIFELSAKLMKNGANRQEIISNLYKKTEAPSPISPEFTHTTNIH